MPLPFVARMLRVHKYKDSIDAIYNALPLFDSVRALTDDVGTINLAERKFEEDGAATKLIIIPAMALRRYGTPTKADIRWLWKFFTGRSSSNRAKWSDSSVLTMLWTTELELYIASNDTSISSWEQPVWVWEWIKCVNAMPKYLQKRGALNPVLDNVVKEDKNVLQQIKQLMKYPGQES